MFAALARETAAREEFRTGGGTDPESLSSAEWFAREAVKRAPGLAEAHWSQAEVLLRLNKPAAALSGLTNALRLQADNSNVLAIQSELARRDGQTNEARALMARALNAPVSRPTSAYLELARVG